MLIRVFGHRGFQVKLIWTVRFFAILLFIAVAVGASAQTITALNYPGALATTAFAINDSGTILGIYGDQSKVAHFYIRSKTGKYTSFDAPSASPAR